MTDPRQPFPPRPTRRQKLLARVMMLASAVAGACSGPAVDTPLPEQTGAVLYVTQRCALCHGSDGSSAFWRPGPDLLPNLDNWTVTSLADYLEDPAAVASGIDRLDGEDMPAYPHLDEATRRRLAAYVLSLAHRDDGGEG